MTLRITELQLLAGEMMQLLQEYRDNLVESYAVHAPGQVHDITDAQVHDITDAQVRDEVQYIDTVLALTKELVPKEAMPRTESGPDLSQEEDDYLRSIGVSLRIINDNYLIGSTYNEQHGMPRNPDQAVQLCRRMARVNNYPCIKALALDGNAFEDVSKGSTS